MSTAFQVFANGVDKDLVVLMAARASRLENQDAIDAAIVAMLADPKEVIYLVAPYSYAPSNLNAFFHFITYGASSQVMFCLIFVLLS